MTKIEWTEHTWNPIVGCTVTSPGCTNCYAMKQAARIERMGNAPHYAGTTQDSKAGPVWTGHVALASEQAITSPLRRRTPTTYFVNSMGDIFHPNVPDNWIDRVFAIMALCPQHTFQVLTKHSGRMQEYLSRICIWSDWAAQATEATGDPCSASKVEDCIFPLPNVWLGVSAEDQTRADQRIPDLLSTPAAVWFVSVEPMLGAIDVRQHLGHDPVYEKQAKREICLSVGSERRFGHPSGRNNMEASQESLGPLAAKNSEPSVQSSAGRTRQRRILPSQSDDRREEGDGIGASPGVAAPSRPDPRRNDDQSQERCEERQPAKKLGDGNLPGSADPRDTHPESGSCLQPIWPEEQHGEADHKSGLGNSTAPQGRGSAQGDSGGLQRIIPDYIKDLPRGPSISWLIVGGESGPAARPMHPDWARDLRDQCAAAGTAFFFKQWGEWVQADHTVCPDSYMGTNKAVWLGWNGVQAKPSHHGLDRPIGVIRVGKKRAGRLLDGREWNEVPTLTGASKKDAPAAQRAPNEGR